MAPVLTTSLNTKIIHQRRQPPVPTKSSNLTPHLPLQHSKYALRVLKRPRVRPHILNRVLLQRRRRRSLLQNISKTLSADPVPHPLPLTQHLSVRLVGVDAVHNRERKLPLCQILCEPLVIRVLTNLV